MDRSDRSDPIPFATAVLYHNMEYTSVVVDTPRSIVLAQGSGMSDRLKTLLSCTPLQEPFKDPTPKSEKASHRIGNYRGDEEWHVQLTQRVKKALDEVKSAAVLGDRFCLPRAVEPRRSQSKKRRLSHAGWAQVDYVEPSTCVHRMTDSALLQNAGREVSGETSNKDLSSLLSGLAADGPKQERMVRYLQACNSDSANFLNHRLCSDAGQEDDWDEFMHNESPEAQVLSLGPKSNLKSHSKTFRFHIPPQSSFLLANCNNTPCFRAAARSFTPNTRGKFELILLDPPWPNASASRKKAYGTKNIHSCQALLLGMDLDTHTQPGGFLAMWVTNKASIRRLALGAGGLFQAWNVALVEEWTWLKVTSNGEPVTPLDGLWKKPYEILLIARAPDNPLAVAQPASEVVRRIFIGVPDLHSRKPCLKESFGRLLFGDRDDFVALEVFARHLVKGWMSWGDEVLKYNWDRSWVDADGEPDRSASGS